MTPLPEPPPEKFPSRARLIGWIAGIVLATPLLSWAIIHCVVTHATEKWRQLGPDMFYYLMGFYEPYANALVVISAVVFAASLYFTRTDRPVTLGLKWPHVLVMAVVVFLFCFAGAKAVYREFPLSLDEYVAFYQARIFSSGHVEATIPPDLLWLKNVIVPEFLFRLGGTHVIEGYLPVYSLLLAGGTVLLGTPWVVNPLLGAGSLVLIFAVARHLRLDSSLPGWSVVLLATSSQFVVNSLSSYAMPSHLFFSLAWLYFYTHPNRRLYYLCPPLGVLAIGLHQPVCHVLFVLPFLLRMLRDRRWTAAGYSALVYLVGGLFWVHWILTTRPDTQGDVQGFFGLPTLRTAFFTYMSLLLVISWQNFLMPVFLIAAFFKWKQWPPFFRDLAAGVGLMVLFYLLFKVPQGGGWGYRYLYPVFGNMVLIAAWAASRARISRWTFAAMAVLALGVQLPFRCVEVRQVVDRQFAPYQYIAHLDADFVIVDREHGWLSVELVRNNPDFRNRPILLFRQGLTDDQLARLTTDYKTVIISRDEFRRLGVPPQN